MPNFTDSTLLSVCLGIALSASCGFRIFIPLLAASIATYYNIIPTPENFQWIGSIWSIVLFSVAAIVEICAYYIPFIDNIMDTIGAPIAMIAGTLLASTTFPNIVEEPALKWILALIAGGGTAGTIHLGNSFLRLLSSKLSLGFGNSAVSTSENVTAIGMSTMSFFTPIIMVVIVCLLILFSIIMIMKGSRKLLKR